MSKNKILNICVAGVIALSSASALANPMKYLQWLEDKRVESNNASKSIVRLDSHMLSKTLKSESLKIVTPPSRRCYGPDDCIDDLNPSVIAVNEFIEEIEGFAKDVSRSAAVYKMEIGIKRMCPQCEEVMEWLEKQSKEINDFMLGGSG